jgi:hypothetical protein
MLNQSGSGVGVTVARRFTFRYFYLKAGRWPEHARTRSTGRMVKGVIGHFEVVGAQDAGPAKRGPYQKRVG